jgi:hypothetical protein
MFVHLKLAADPIPANAFDDTPTMAALACGGYAQAPTQLLAATTPASRAATGSC